ncbi:imidazole glycerol phosphate synthase subunit HisH [Campylobacter hepaticus]|uniref:Imidazole glycerol phosphate synthase subunit HisH n=1 Tax=Campylobacter hepaticus TaxID=1813019 RepID=A0A424Z271_9BACT|nr:imidazole glycerol phosphate synthase subunit HisH [Campylobacter hepaticus]AXP08236.1 imidazole glycerol phosphate synthase subunit HisH [Campylobacter hepaticus]MCZ0772055.1 imidazole glycerol phosphate synthase subunit HisH [Campylobacter hepaticus]MCZ0773524.1 imidazole glycerol phosphate synthase subunit HisH [Campylobacter hepaticus]MCZ0774774.1 imidazole glycerol phosphate synthase subunit HisH [Campylobacter hepaticus]MDX2322654.1 imidazole glycerol phosphate synthase subunit HisH [
MIAIIDYKAGNLNSVIKALDKIGAKNFIAQNQEDFKKASKLLLPGVGSFKEAMLNLEKFHLIEALKEQVLIQKKPILGICLGMQLFLEQGYEGGVCKGLGLIEGEVVKFEDDLGLKIPHMGWNDLDILKKDPLYKDIDNKSDFYFVHSFYVRCKDEFVSAKTQYGHKFASSLQKDNIFATQFHPEKSQNLGLKLLENFTRL